MSSFADPFTGLLNIANDINLANEVYDKDTSITFSSSTPSSFSSFISSSSYSLLPSPNPENSDLIYNFVAPAISRALSDVDLRVTPELLQRLLNPLPTPPSTPSSSSSYSGEWLAGSALLRSLASKYLSPTDQHDFAMETLSMSSFGASSLDRISLHTINGVVMLSSSLVSLASSSSSVRPKRLTSMLENSLTMVHQCLFPRTYMDLDDSSASGFGIEEGEEGEDSEEREKDVNGKGLHPPSTQTNLHTLISEFLPPSISILNDLHSSHPTPALLKTSSILVGLVTQALGTTPAPSPSTISLIIDALKSVPSITTIDVMFLPRRLQQYKLSNSITFDVYDAIDFDPEVDGDDTLPALDLSSLPFEVSPPWSIYGSSLVAYDQFTSASVPSVLLPAQLFELGWPHVHILLKWGEETSSFDRTSAAISLANLILDKIPPSHLSPSTPSLTKPSQLLLNALMNYQNLSTSIPILLLKLTSKLETQTMIQSFFLSLIGPAPSPPLKAILLNIYKKISPPPSAAAPVFAPFLDEMVSLSADSASFLPTLLENRDVYHECVIYLCQHLSAFPSSTVKATLEFNETLKSPQVAANWQLALLSDAISRIELS